MNKLKSNVDTLKQFFGSNIQVYQTLILSTWVLLGIFYFGLHLTVTKILIVFLTTSITDLCLTKYFSGKWKFSFSSINAGFGICFFLRTDVYLIYVFAGLTAIFTKHLLRVDGKHFFNPSNIGVVTSLILFQGLTWTSPFQWGLFVDKYSYFLLYGMIIVLGIFLMWRLLVIKKVVYFDLIAGFALTHVALFFLLGSTLDSGSFLRAYTAGFLIFCFHMITDPQTNLSKPRNRALYGVSIAVISYLLIYLGLNAAYANLFALTLMTLSLPILRRLEMAELPFGVVKILLTFILLNTTLMAVLADRQPSINFGFTKSCPAVFCN